MADLIDREEAIAAINGLCLCGEGVQMIWSSDAVDAIKNLRPRIKSPNYIKLLPCTCGSKRRQHWCAQGGVFLKCEACGKTAPVGRWEMEAHRNWNAMIEAEVQNKT